MCSLSCSVSMKKFAAYHVGNFHLFGIVLSHKNHPACLDQVGAPEVSAPSWESLAISRAGRLYIRSSWCSALLWGSTPSVGALCGWPLKTRRLKFVFTLPKDCRRLPFLGFSFQLFYTFNWLSGWQAGEIIPWVWTQDFFFHSNCSFISFPTLSFKVFKISLQSISSGQWMTVVKK